MGHTREEYGLGLVRGEQLPYEDLTLREGNAMGGMNKRDGLAEGGGVPYTLVASRAVQSVFSALSLRVPEIVDRGSWLLESGAGKAQFLWSDWGDTSKGCRKDIASPMDFGHVFVCHPQPLARTTLKSQKFDGNNGWYCCSDKGVPLAGAGYGEAASWCATGPEQQHNGALSWPWHRASFERGGEGVLDPKLGVPKMA